MRLELKIIFILICITQFSTVVSAYYEVEQGDTVYIGETVDISRVLSWKMQFAYWKNGYYGGDNPDKTITVDGYMYSYYIDPQKYEAGTYWKWDGKEEGAGNNLAFYVKEGVRPETTPTPAPTPNGTIQTNVTPTQNQTMPELPLGEHVLIARGDFGTINYRIDDSKLINGLPQKAYLWLFGSTSKIMSAPLASTKTGNIYTYEFTSEYTNGLQEGQYVGYLQFVGNNNQQDVFYDAGNNTLDSPFKAVTPVDLDPFIPTRIMHEFERMEIPSIYTDDFLVPITVDITTPTITIGDYWEDGDNIIVEGKTNLAVGSNIVAMIDPDNFAIPSEIAAHKYSAKATGNYSDMRQYSISLPIKWEELNIGQHTIKISAQKYQINLEVFKDFQVTGLWIMPTPTPELKKVLVEDYGSHQITAKTPNITQVKTPSPTPAQVVVNGTVRNITSRNMTLVRPANWTPPNITNNTTVILTPPPTPVPTKIPEPTPSDDIVIPVNPIIAIIAVIIAGFILTRHKGET